MDERDGSTLLPVGQVFISYRREDSSGHSGRLHDSLTARFGSAVDVFMDVDDIPAGSDFGEAIQSAVSSSDALLVVIGPRWIGIRDREGRRRLDDPSDFVRLEIAAALAHGVRIIPVLVQGARMPSAAELPADLAPLARREAIQLSDERWKFDIGRLADALGPTRARPWYRRPVVLAAGAVVLVASLVLVVTVTVRRSADFSASAAGTVPPPTDVVGPDRPTTSLSKLLFSDSMAPPDVRWATSAPRTNGLGCQVGPTEDGYSFRVTGRDYYCASLVDFELLVGDLEDVAVEATLGITEQTPPGDPTGGPGLAGLKCRARGHAASGDGYSFGVGPTGYYQLVRYVDGQQKTLTTGIDSSLKVALDRPINLRLECIGRQGESTTVRLLSGGREVARFVDIDGLPPGAPGLDAASFGEPSFGVSFTDFRVFGTG